ncbi:MAG: GNAT family N-acetyltransferase [Puia sp.]|nr:GNAT family N-acetyltransferase [Puia sp.]
MNIPVINIPVIIRKAAPDDMERLLVFEQCIVKAEQDYDSTLKREKTNYYDLREMMGSDASRLVVAEHGRQVIGTGHGRIEASDLFLKHREHALLGFMYIVPEYRGQGVIKMIIEALVDWAGSKNINEFRLEVYEQNKAAIRAYEKMRFSRHIVEMRMSVPAGTAR